MSCGRYICMSVQPMHAFIHAQYRYTELVCNEVNVLSYFT